MVFQLLKEYKEQANKERFFITSEKEKIELFSDVIKKSIEFCFEINYIKIFISKQKKSRGGETFRTSIFLVFLWN